MEEAKGSSEIELLEEIALSEWQPMDIEKLSTDEQQGRTCNQEMEMQVNAFSEWDPVERTGKPMEIQKAQAMAETGYFQEISKVVEAICPTDNSASIQFRTASNKAMKLTEAMKTKAAMLMADLEIVVDDQAGDDITIKNMQKIEHASASRRDEVATDCDLLAGIPFSEWQPMDIPDSKRDELDVSNQLEIIPFSEWQPIDIPDARQQPKEVTSRAQHKTEYKQNELFENIEFRTASNRALTLTKEMRQKAAMLMADLETVNADPHESIEIHQKVEASCSQTTIEIANDHLRAEILNPVEFHTASNKVLKLTNEMRQKAAMLMSDLEAVNANPPVATEDLLNRIEVKESTMATKAKDSCSQLIREDDENAQPNISECIEFHTASNKVLKLTKEMRQKAAMLMADLEVNQPLTTKEWFDEDCTAKGKSVATNLSKTSQRGLKERGKPKLTIETIDGIYPLDIEPEKGIGLNTAFPLEHNQHSQDLIFETPKGTTELQCSLTQLSERSPLDSDTKSSIITRRNLLSLNKRRKQKRKSENCNDDAGHTPIRRFASLAAATSTPMPSHKENNVKEDEENPPPSMRERSCSQDSPRLERKRICKRKSEDALSPIYAPTHKTRRLGLSRIRNKSTQEI